MAKNNDYRKYYTDGNSDIRKVMDDAYRESITDIQQFWTEADVDLRFKAGDQTIWNQLYPGYNRAAQKVFQFNRIRRVSNMICGHQRKNRKTSIVIPIESSDQQAADDFSGVIQWANNSSNAYKTLSESFEGAITTGFNLLSVWMDYRNDPINGDIRVDNLGHAGCLIDTHYKKKDLSDANFIWTRRWLSKNQIASLLPERRKEIEEMPNNSGRDDKFIFLPENTRYGQKGFLPYDEYWYLDYRQVDMLIDAENGESMEWTGDKEALDIFRYRYPDIQVVKSQKQTVKLAISVNNRVMYDGPNPFGIDRYPFVGVYGYFEPEVQNFSLKMQGVVRSLRDAQYLFNRRKQIELDILESQINTGIKFKESALVDPDDAFLTGQGRRLAIRDSASMDDVQMIQAPEIPQSAMQLSQQLAEEIQQISGVNEELLGSADDDKAGVLSMLRQGAGLVTLQTLFDQLDESQTNLGRIYVDLIQQNFSPAKVERILGRGPSEQFYNKAFQKYDCEVAEGILTETQKQMQFRQLLELRQLEIPIPIEILIDAAPLQNKQELIDAITAQEQAQQQQAQQQSQLQMEEQQIINNSLLSKAESDKALAAERMNKIQIDQISGIEKIEKAEQDKSDALLNKVKAMKELASMDITNIINTVNALKTIQEIELNNNSAQSSQPQPQVSAQQPTMIEQ